MTDAEFDERQREGGDDASATYDEMSVGTALRSEFQRRTA